MFCTQKRSVGMVQGIEKSANCPRLGEFSALARAAGRLRSSTRFLATLSLLTICGFQSLGPPSSLPSAVTTAGPADQRLQRADVIDDIIEIIKEIIGGDSSDESGGSSSSGTGGAP